MRMARWPATSRPGFSVAPLLRSNASTRESRIHSEKGGGFIGTTRSNARLSWRGGLVLLVQFLYSRPSFKWDMSLLEPSC